MENLSLIKFQQLNPHYYMCKSCGTHIALAEDFINYNTRVPELIGALFKKGVNIYVKDKPRLERITWHTIADIYCKGCNSLLGLKYLEADKYQTRMVMLNKKKLVMRYGNDFFDGETMERLPPPDHYKCRKCRTYVALVEDVCYCTSEIADQNLTSRIIFKKVVNVRIIPDASLFHKVGLHTFAGVKCANCNLLLGWKMVASDPRSFAWLLQSEQVELYINAILRSQGNNIVPAETMILPYP